MRDDPKMIRISWSLPEENAEVFSGKWHPAGDHYILATWITHLSELYPEIKHWIERKDEQ
jgi:hypothetical protein